MSLKGSIAKSGENNPRFIDGLSKTKEYRRRFYENHPDASKLYRSRSWALAKELRDRHKSNPCSDCKNVFPPYVMHFDHRDGATKSFNIGAEVGRIGLPKLKEEIAKCDVVCANCHAVRTFKRRMSCAL